MSQGHDDDIQMEPVNTRRDSSSHSSDNVQQHNQFEHLSLLEEGRANEINNRLTNIEGHLNRLTGTVEQMNHMVQELRNQTARSRWDVPDRMNNTFFSVTGGAASLIGLGYTLKAYYA
ncbi:MAG TPA: hypothetical protein VL485_15170 [Ktedonobacteraceae bacterium]|nr:hypothetical protein [Ktedonobacteraceae bacterium]